MTVQVPTFGAEAELRARARETSPSTRELMLDRVFRRAESAAHAPALSFLADGVRVSEHLTYGDLCRRILSVSQRLRDTSCRGERALLLFQDGLHFPVALLACFNIGLIAVPAFMPARARVDAGLERLRSIVRGSGATLVLCDAPSLARRRELAERAPELASLLWINTADVPSLQGNPGERARPMPSDVAFIQYTSGSTATPKGVMVTHDNVLHNEETLRRRFEMDEDAVVVSWLPPYHDMGLIGGVLNPLFVGGHGYLMSAMTFLRNPSRWLRAISDHGATVSAAPDFAYAYCAQEVSEDEKRLLDLRSWRVAVSGGEVVRAETLRRFSSAFAACGFAPEAFRPSYGLAESTLIVATSSARTRHDCLRFDREELLRGRAIPKDTPEGTVELVSSGTWLGDSDVRITEPETGREQPEGVVGEVWIRGRSVTAGYYGSEDETRAAFGAYVQDKDHGPFCRTGDLGFIRAGQLFIAGRLKDLVIHAGKNHYSEDIERTVEGVDPAIARPAAAFSVDESDEERLIVVIELNRRRGIDPQPDVEDLKSAIRRSVFDAHRIAVHEIVLVRRGMIPKTSSGKVRRSACRRAFEKGTLASARMEGP